MLNLPTKLKALDDPIRVGIVGAGLFGTKLADQIECAPGMTVAAIADIEPKKASDTFTEAGVEETVIEAETVDEADRVIKRGERVILSDGRLLAETDVNVVVEATGVPDVGARHAYAALAEGKHVINATVEADTVVGPALATLADEQDVTYSLAYGDQPALMVELCDWARTIGMDIVAAGRGSMYVDEYRFGTPDDVFERWGYDDEFIDEHDLNPRMYNSFLDGTKIAVESCALANAVGLEPDVPGMHLRTLEAHEVPTTLRLKEDGGVLGQTNTVEAISSLYSDGSTTELDLSWSMFVVARTPNQAVQEYFSQNRGHGFYVASDGEYVFFYRPHHLPGIETPVSVANAMLRNEPTGAPRGRYAEVVGAAKRTLEPGTELDGGGGYTTYGTLEAAERARECGYVPFELLDGATVTSSIDQDDVLTYDDVELEDSFIKKLRENPSSVSP
ncbi:NAD(P)H-dependent oxidoreductase [Saliphagus sp. LR7]|uniref:NAD(P)H-dependent oxidoreductase n=1 Tax=Saliphagus sp. LR7 TaxID=2282654 RepID=UPI000DF7FEC2|nr:Gfo/Idh/MocA family oxidoreductase [Saliphagus sp. LR7]